MRNASLAIGEAPSSVAFLRETLGGRLPRALVEIGQHALSRLWVRQLAEALAVWSHGQVLQVISCLEPIL
jgi:hypothetical protein